MDLRVPLLPWWVRWTVVAGLAAFIFYVSIVTVPPETVVDQVKPSDAFQRDKWRHFVAYAALGYALAYATTDWDLDGRTLAAVVLLTTVVYGVGIEFGQSLLPSRYFSVADGVANALGGTLVLPWYLLRSRVEFVPVSRFAASLTQ
jgi:VanZ family protein